jgi:hypothetical protein
MKLAPGRRRMCGRPGAPAALVDNRLVLGYNIEYHLGGNMRKLMSRSGWLLVLLMLGLSLPAQEIPENVKNSLDGLQKTRAANGVFGIQFQGAYFWALEKSVYVSVLFTAGLDSDATGMKDLIKKQYDERVASEMKKLEAVNKKIKKEEDKKKWEPPALEYPKYFHALYMRVVKGGQVIQEYRSQVPFDDEAAKYYSFGTVLEPGDYDVLLDIDRSDNTLDGTLLIPLQVPALRLSDITIPAKELKISKPVFYSEVKQLLQPEPRFTVVKNKFENGPAQLDFFPWGDRPFKSGDKPTLAFFILGAVAVQSAEPWDISAVLEFRSGKDRVAKFEEMKLTNPYFYQPIEFVKKENGNSSPLAPGDYVLGVELKDNNQSGKAAGKFEIPFKIIE